MSELTGSNHRRREQFKCPKTVVGKHLLEMDPTVCPITTTTTTSTTTTTTKVPYMHASPHLSGTCCFSCNIKFVKCA